MSVTGPSSLHSVKPRMAREEWPVAVAWHSGILYPDTSSMPRPSSSTAQSGESETLLLRCLARQHPAQPSPGSRQPDFYFFMLASAQPSTTAKLPTVSLHPAGAGAGPGQDCHTNVLYHHYLCTQPRHGAMGLYSNIYTYTHTESIPFTSLLQCQSSIQYSMSLTGRYLDI